MRRVLLWVLIGLVLAFSVLWLMPDYAKGWLFLQSRSWVFRIQGLLAAPAATPEEAYEKFRAALARGGSEYNRYLSPEAKEVYKFILTREDKRQLVLSWKAPLVKQYQIECEPFEMCLEVAVYKLEYYREEFEMMGQKVEAGYTTREISFIRRLDGGWWIKKL